jgi:hypothetical protein
MSSQIPISAPRAVCIPSLNKVLAPFYGSFWGTRIAIFCSANLLQEFLELGNNLSSGDKETHMKQHWHQMLEGLRNPSCTYYYKDPESLQVAQVLARLDPLELTQEFATKSKYMNGQVLDAWASKGDNYFTVARGTKWLCDCARRFLPKEISLSEKSSVLQNLRFMATPQPKYLDMDVRYPIEEDTEIFGQDGLIVPFVKRLTTDTSDDADILFLIEVVMHQAMNVADVWEAYHYSPGHPRRISEYRWYISSLAQAREKFLMDFEQPCILSNGQEVSRAMRKAIIDFPFVELWNVLWKRAKSCTNMIRDSLKKWVIKSFKRYSDPDTGRIYTINIEARMRSMHRLSSLPQEIDIGSIRSGIPCSLATLERASNWARHLYPDECITEARDARFRAEVAQRRQNEEEIPEEISRNTYDLSHLEAHGHCIDPKNYSVAVSDPPMDQNCTICAEAYTYPSADGSQMGEECVQLSTCGHYFHYECIGTWMNGVSANTNTCPECRAVICEGRREVRVKEVDQ